MSAAIGRKGFPVLQGVGRPLSPIEDPAEGVRRRKSDGRVQDGYARIVLDSGSRGLDPSPPPDRVWLAGAEIKALSNNRDRGQPHGCTPPTPPDIRVRIRRFGGLSEHLFPQKGQSPGF